MNLAIVISDEELGCRGNPEESEGCSDCTGGILRIKDGVCSTGRGLLCSKVQPTGFSLAVVSRRLVFRVKLLWIPCGKHCIGSLMLLTSHFSQILNGVARYALVNAIANSFLEFELCGVFYVGGLLLSRGAITVLQLWRYACCYLKQKSHPHFLICLLLFQEFQISLDL